MRRLLPDTQLLIWLAEKPGLLPKLAYSDMQNADNELVFSLVSIWEVSIKAGLKRSDFTTDPEALRNGLLRIGFSELPILPAHVMAVSKLPSIHRDPFDRLLVAQAQIEGLSLLTTDKKLSQYGVSVQRY